MADTQYKQYIIEFKLYDGTTRKIPIEIPMGEDGGFYTPATRKVSDTEIEISFTPSKDGMPAVEPVQVTLPAGTGSGGNVELDTTLTQSGKAADAKAVGDKIAEITGISLVEPAEDDMPKVFITGVKPTTKDDVLAEMQYISKTDSFHAYLEIKCQGTSSMSWPKKNFTVKLYSDEARETKLKKDFKDWNHPGNKFVLKANYIDHSHARNIVSARLWGEVVASRTDYDSLPEEMRNSPNNGAIDGFPIKVYYNGNYEGVYTWNIGKDDWMWGMDDDNPNHVLLCAEGNTDGVYAETTSNFRKLWNGVDGQKPGWSVEVGTNSTALKNSLNNLIQFVIDNDGDAFRNGIGNYLDIQSAIDYYIFQYEICGLDGLAHNMLLATYDGVLWHCGAYDMDSTFGLWWDGGKFVSAQYACPEDYQERYSLLWERIEANFLPELKARQAELRKTVLSYSNMVTHFERFMDIIGLDLYAEDLTIYTGIPSGSTNNIKQIRNYIRDRQAYVDAEFAAMSDPVPCTGISLNKSTIDFTAEGSQTLIATVTPDSCTDALVWVSSNPLIARISVNGNSCVVEPVANGNATITVTCGEYSATCTVTASCFREPVPCTGISLSATELTFNGEGSQNIFATVEPADTTDGIAWSVSPAGIVTVTDGLVTAVGGGSCIVTATCGGHSAHCSVTVSGIAVNIFAGAEVHSGEIKSGSGEIVSVANCAYTDAVDISAYAGKLAYLNPNSSDRSYCRVAFYDESNTYISEIGNENVAYGYIPNNVKYARMSLYGNGATGTLCVHCSNKFETETVKEGAYTPSTGELNSDDTASCHVKFETVDGFAYTFEHLWGVFYFDSSNQYISNTFGMNDAHTGRYIITLPDGARSIAACTNDIRVDSGIARIDEWEPIGSV